MEYYGCVCSCGKYETSCDMGAGTAMRAGVMHEMLGNEHQVKVFTIRDNTTVCWKLNDFIGDTYRALHQSSSRP